MEIIGIPLRELIIGVAGLILIEVFIFKFLRYQPYRWWWPGRGKNGHSNH